MKAGYVFLMICVSFIVYSQDITVAMKEHLTSINISANKGGINYRSNEEGFYSPGSPFIDTSGRVIFGSRLDSEHLIIFSENQIIDTNPNATPIQIVSSTLASQQGMGLVSSIQYLFDGLKFLQYDYDIKGGSFSASYITYNYDAPWGALLYSDREKAGIAVVFDVKNPVPDFYVVDQVHLKDWLPAQLGGFRIGSDGLLYRNGILWSAQLPANTPRCAYIGRLASGHTVWASGKSGMERKYYISNADRQVEIVLELPWAINQNEYIPGATRWFNYGLGSWGELYCLIAPLHIEGKEYYTPQLGMPAELVVVRNHLKYFGRLNDGGVRLRKEPNTTSEILGTYPNKTGFRILEKSEKEETIAGQKNVWYKVRLLDGKVGWFFGSFVHNLYDGPNGNPPPWPNVPDW